MATNWQMTVYEGQYQLLDKMPPGVKAWGWQDEICPDTGRKHRQGYVQLTRQQRLSFLRKILPGVHVEIARNIQDLILYCSKEATRDPDGQQIRVVNDIPTAFALLDEIKTVMQYENKYCSFRDMYQSLTRYERTYIPSDTLNEFIEYHALLHLRVMIKNGRRGIEWIGSNPMWSACWKKFASDLVSKNHTHTHTKSNIEYNALHQLTGEASTCD